MYIYIISRVAQPLATWRVWMIVIPLAVHVIHAYASIPQCLPLLGNRVDPSQFANGTSYNYALAAYPRWGTRNRTIPWQNLVLSKWEKDPLGPWPTLETKCLQETSPESQFASLRFGNYHPSNSTIDQERPPHKLHRFYTVERRVLAVCMCHSLLLLSPVKRSSPNPYSSPCLFSPCFRRKLLASWPGVWMTMMMMMMMVMMMIPNHVCIVLLVRMTLWFPFVHGLKPTILKPRKTYPPVVKSGDGKSLIVDLTRPPFRVDVQMLGLNSRGYSLLLVFNMHILWATSPLTFPSLPGRGIHDMPPWKILTCSNCSTEN